VDITIRSLSQAKQSQVKLKMAMFSGEILFC
jgi:hypothetical protein